LCGVSVIGKDKAEWFIQPVNGRLEFVYRPNLIMLHTIHDAIDTALASIAFIHENFCPALELNPVKIKPAF
jgi:hypothetical protein